MVWACVYLVFHICPRRDFRATRGPYFFDYPVVYAQMLLVFLLCTTFSTLSPLVLPFGLIYFALLWMSSKYLLLYCCTPQHPSNGEIFPAIFTRLCWSMLTFQVVLFGVLGGRNYIGAVAIGNWFEILSFRLAQGLSPVPLIVAQVLFWLWTDKQVRSLSSVSCVSRWCSFMLARNTERWMPMQRVCTVARNPT